MSSYATRIRRQEARLPAPRRRRWGALLVALTTGCATTQGADQPGPTAREYSPFHVGAHWTYDVQYFGQKGRMTVKIEEVTKDGYFRDTRNGFFKHTLSGLRDKDRYLIMHPLVPGHKWSALVGPMAKEEFIIQSVGQPCDVPAGQFANCLTIESKAKAKGNELSITWVWAKDVGLVSIETFLVDVKGRVLPQTKQNLSHYSLTGDTPPPPDIVPKTPAPPPAPPPAKAPAARSSEQDDGPDTWVSE